MQHPRVHPTIHHHDTHTLLLCVCCKANIEGEDVYDTLGNMIGTVKDGALALSNATGVTEQDM
jgi:hypothetical protein